MVIDGFEVLIINYMDDIDTNTGNDADLVRMCKFSLGAVKTTLWKVRGDSPKRFAPGTREGMGFI